MRDFKSKVQSPKSNASPKSTVHSPKSRFASFTAFAALASFASFALFASPAFAQGPNLDDQVNRISKELYCPVCPNTPLDVCDTLACQQWRALIKDRLQKGESEQQIREYFVAQYGNRVLGAPPAEGFNWLAYILPGVALIVGGAAVWATARRWRATRADRAMLAQSPPLAREYSERIEKELRESSN